MRLHREGYSVLAIGALILGTFNVVLLHVAENIVFLVLAGSGMALVFLAAFFRMPSRTTPSLPNTIIAPADGRVVKIKRVYEPEYFQEERLLISIFMTLFNVHANWIPADGEVIYYRYHPGKYLVALHPKSSVLNERSTIVIQTSAEVPVLVRQIAGLLAQRIRTYIAENQTVTSGGELGFIKFGSRVDVFLPLDSVVLVKPRQRVKGGETILAELPVSPEHDNAVMLSVHTD